MKDFAAPAQPDADIAAGIAAAVTGGVPEAVRRFTTGTRHFVFEVAFADGPAVVVRLGAVSAHAEMAGAVRLSALLRPLGVRLPEILAADLRAERPWLLLERLPGTDLGAVIAGLSDDRLDRIAAAVARAQAITAATGSAGRYGYAVLPAQAPYAAWPQVLDASLGRSRQRIAAAGLFDAGPVHRVQAALDALRGPLDRIAPTPFLHDTTVKNVIVTADGGFSGIVDVDDLCFGDPRYPAALTLAALLARGGPVQYVAAWLRHAGLPDDRLFRLYVSLFLLDLMAEHGLAGNGNLPPSTPEARAALRRALDASLA